MQRAKELFDEMTDKGLQPSNEVFVYLLKSPLTAGEAERSAVMQVMEKFGIGQSVEMFNAQLGTLYSLSMRV